MEFYAAIKKHEISVYADQEIVKDREARHAAVHGVTELDTT